MKKIGILLFLALFAWPQVSLAHTTLTSSTPAEGEVVVEPLEEVELTFGTVIEEASKMTLESEGMTYEFEKLAVSGEIMTGSLSADLPNGAYVIRWTIIGADGHLIEGEVPFELAVETAAEESVVEKEEPVAEEPVAVEPEVSTVPEETEAREGSPWVTILVGAAVLAVLFGAFRLWKKK